MPAANIASTVRCNRVRSPIFNKHFGHASVSGRSRFAIPAASITPIIFNLSFLIFNLHQRHTDGYPDDFAYTADDADKDAQGSRESQGGNTQYEATFLHTNLHG